MEKGILDLYNELCQDLCDEYFIDWMSSPSLCFGMICKSVAWYVKTDRWYLEEANYDPIREENSTWYAKKYTGKYSASNPSMIMKYFKLEKEEKLITTNGKERPVILLSYSLDSWWNPSNSSKHEKTWLCIPLFTYKPRHPQSYVLNEQHLQNKLAFYIPSCYSTYAGTHEESSARFQGIQMIKEEHLTPLKAYCLKDEMSRPFGLTKIGMELLMYHFYDQFGLFPELLDSNTNYTLFKEEANRRIDAAFETNP